MTDPATIYPANAVGHDFTPGAHDWRHKRHFSGQAVIAGIVTALAVQIMLGLFGVALELGSIKAINPTTIGMNPLLAIGATVWGAGSLLAALFYGGFIAARLSRNWCHHMGILHGIVAWAGTVLVVAFLVASPTTNIFAIAQNTSPNATAQTPAVSQVVQTDAHAGAEAATAAGVILLFGFILAGLGGSLGALHVKHHSGPYVETKKKL